MAGLVFRAADYDEGSTAPPFHLNCGCAVREYWGEREEEDEDVEVERGWWSEGRNRRA